MFKGYYKYYRRCVSCKHIYPDSLEKAPKVCRYCGSPLHTNAIFGECWLGASQIVARRNIFGKYEVKESADEGSK